MTKSCILQILNLKQNVDCNLCGGYRKTIKATKFIFKSPKLIDSKLLLCRYLLKKPKTEATVRIKNLGYFLWRNLPLRNFCCVKANFQLFKFLPENCIKSRVRRGEFLTLKLKLKSKYLLVFWIKFNTSRML